MKRMALVASLLVVLILAGGESRAFSLGKTKYFYKKGSGTWVKVCPGNKKQGPFDHPRHLAGDDVKKVLSSLQYFRPGFFSFSAKKGKEYSLFTEEEIELLAEPLVQAFAEADSSQWVDFSINTFRGQAFIGSFRQSDGVMFIKEGKLNVALRNIAVKTNIDDSLNTFDPTRGYRSLTRMAAVEGQEQVADNWVAINLSQLPEPPGDVSAEVPTLDLSITSSPPQKKSDAQPPPAETSPPPAATQPSPPSPPPAAEKRSAKERLLELQQLYDQGLISEEEYQKKRKEILDEL